jgi:choloylglycine hydrolase
MCTALSIKAMDSKVFFGRNMDLAYNFNQHVLIMPPNYQYRDMVTGNIVTNHEAIIGMGTVIDNHATFADAMNTKGLACAGLNFDGYAYFEKKSVDGKLNIAPYDFIQWALSNYTTVNEVKEGIKELEFVDAPLNSETPVPTLHWMVTDKSGESIVVEKTVDGVSVHENPVGVMTNNPTFDWHLTNLNEYLYLSPVHHKKIVWSNKELQSLGIGSGTLGIPGDFASVSRFVRIAYLRANTPDIKNDNEAISQFFNMLDYVKMVRGGVMTQDGIEDFTLYSSCMNLNNGIYFYRSYNNSRIHAIDIRKEKYESAEIISFPYLAEQDYNYQN